MVVKICARADMDKNNKFKNHVSQNEPNAFMEKDNTMSEIDTLVHLITQEIKFARTLAGNDASLRDKKLRDLKKWFKIRSSSSYPFKEEDFLRIWKGLFYCMWMSDKPLVQEDLAENLGSLFHCFDNPENAIDFFGAFLQTMYKEWFGIDQWRIDKFMMLVRRVTRQIFFVLKKHDWSSDLIKYFGKHISKTILNLEIANNIGFKLHFIELFFEEIAKVSEGKIPKFSVTMFLKPFMIYVSKSREMRLVSHIKHNIFFHLIKQSDMGREYQEKYEIWKLAGCPTSSVDDIEINEEIEEESESDEDDKMSDEEEQLKETKLQKLDQNETPKAYDPRAGLVDVEIYEIPFKPKQIVQVFEKVMTKPEVTRKNRNFIRNITDKFNKYAEYEYPFVDRGFPQFNKIRAEMPDPTEKLKEWNQFEKELYNETREYKKIAKKFKHMSKSKRARCEKELANGNFDFFKKPSKIIPESKKTDEWMEEDIDLTIKNSKKRKKETKKIKSKKLKNSEFAVEDALEVKENNKLDTPSNSGFKETDNFDCTKSYILKDGKLSNKAEKGDQEISDNVHHNIIDKNDFDEEESSDNDSDEDLDDILQNPLKNGQFEYFFETRKNKIKQANEELTNDLTDQTPKKSKLLLNPFAKSSPKTASPINKKQLMRGKMNKSRFSLPNTTLDSASKRVKIVLEKNCAQDTDDYVKQIKSSPQVPYDSSKKPVKGLLKPCLTPSPINPRYKLKGGLNFDDLI